MDRRGRKREKDSAGGNVWTQEGGSERRMVLRGMFGPKREEVREDSAEGNIWTEEGGREERIVLGRMFGPKREEVKGGWC